MTQRQPRLLDPGYLAWLRKQPCCCGCGRPAPSEAAHVRISCLARRPRSVGLQEKPDDSRALPLHAECHRHGPEAQHTIGEEKFWYIRNLDPHKIAADLYAEYGGTGGKPARSRMTKPTAPRKPRHLRAKITSRNNLKRNARCL